VSDLVDGLVRLMESDREIVGPINLGKPVEFTVRQLAETVIRLTGSASTIVSKPLPADDPRQRQPDITKARGLLAWQPTIPLDEGLVTTIEYFRSFL
jgi:UDP-glucuronate decarboxylase